MRAEKITYTLLNVAGVTALVGSSIALARLPENSTYPAIVYEIVSGVPVMPINAQLGGTLMRTRVQITALGRTVSDVKSVLEAVRIALNYQSGTIAGEKVVSIERALVGPDSKDDDAGIFVQPVQYMVTHYEP